LTPRAPKNHTELAPRALQENAGEAESLIGEALEHVQQGNAELRELAHGILPAALTRGGLRAGVGRLDLPVHVDVPAERFPTEIEASAYFIVAEALTNVVKHAHAGPAEAMASVQNGMLHVEVQDDGIGGADPDGHGLAGIGDRVTALGGGSRSRVRLAAARSWPPRFRSQPVKHHSSRKYMSAASTRRWPGALLRGAREPVG